MIFFIWTTVLLAAIIFYMHRSYSRFKDYGVKTPPVIPFLGSMSRLVFRIEDFSRDMNRYFADYPEERFVGRFEFFRPVVFVKDLDLARKITVKDFEHFLDHRRLADEHESLFSRNLLSLKGQEWKDMRSTLSPAFTSSKIKLMVPFMEQAGEQMIRVMKEKIKATETGSVDIDWKDLTARYASDVIASCAFGLKVDSHADEHNEFHEKAMVGSAMNLRQQIVILIMSACPIIAKTFKLTFFSNEIKDFFINLVSSTMKDRETSNIVRPDMIHLLMEAKKGRHLSYNEMSTSSASNGSTDRDAGFAAVEESFIGKRNIERVWSEIDLFAQGTLFFIAGFETVSTAMAFALYELALNPDVQDRLYKEIKENDIKYGGKLNFAGIQNMTYLDMVVSESLRKWPPALALDRVCSKDYNMGKPNAKSTKDYIIRKGETVLIPTWGFHRNPEYFPNPDKFDPERFSEENKHMINPMAYMPFGQGPRNCIGSRFALCELKIFLYHILLHIEVSPSARTQLPSILSPECFNPRLVGGHWLTFRAKA